MPSQLVAKSVKSVTVASIIFMSVFNINIANAASLGPDTIADMVEKNIDAVVNISTSRFVAGKKMQEMPNFPEGSPFEDLFKQFFNEKLFENNNKGDDKQKPRKRRVGSLGSGFVISKDGYIVTNAHVIADAEEITVVLNNGDELEAELVGSDKKTDIALLKVKPKSDLTFVKFGDDKKMRTGHWVVTIGNPFGVGVSVSAGIVSAQNRNINSGPYDDFIQTDAGINKGNSGGPLFNLDGEVVGVNSALLSPTGVNIGIGFSIPASTVVPVIEQLKEFGTTRRGWLGISFMQVSDDIAESLGMKEATGAFINRVFKDSPADKAGLKRQDVILEFNGKKIDGPLALPKIVANTEIDKKVSVLIIRGGEEQELDVKVGLLKEGEKQAITEIEGEQIKREGATILGLKLQELNEDIIEEFKLDPETKGLIITGVDDESIAAEKGLRVGDRILEAAQSVVSSYKDLKLKIKQMEDKGRKTILLLVETANGDIRFVALPIK